MKAIVCLALLVLVVNAGHIHRSAHASSRRLSELKKGNSWASIIVNLAEMHTLARGPFDELVVAIQSVISDIEAKTESANAEFDRRTQEHNSEVRRLTELINEAVKNIADTQELINNVLVPQRDQLAGQVADLERRIEETKAYITAQTEARNVAHQEFLVRVEDHTEAIAVLGEALGVLEQLEEDGDVSFVQLKKAHKHVEKVTQTLQKHKYSVENTLLRSLIALSTNEFANQDAIQKVKNLMLQVRSNLEASLEQEKADEEKAQADFEADVERSLNEIGILTAQLEETQNALAATEEQIAQAQLYIEERERDRAEYQADLDTENSDYDEATRRFEDLIAQLEHESAACQEALELVQNATVDDYISERIEQTSEHVIGTNHGSGVEVAGGRFQFDN